MTYYPSPQDNQAQLDARLLGAWLSASPALMIVGGGGSDHVQMLEDQEHRVRLQKYLPTTPKKIASWLSIGLGLVCLFGAVLPSSDGVTWTESFLTGVGSAVVFGLPGSYWMWNYRRDRKHIDQWVRANASYRDQLSHLSEADRSLMSEPDVLPRIPKRHWLVVWGLVFAAIVLIGVFAPDVAASA